MTCVLYMVVITFLFVTVTLELVIQGTMECGRKLQLWTLGSVNGKQVRVKSREG